MNIGFIGLNDPRTTYTQHRSGCTSLLIQDESTYTNAVM